MVTLISHPLIEDQLTRLRDKNTGVRDFRESIDILTGFLIIEATRDLLLESVAVETPIRKCVSQRLADPAPYIFVVLRAGQAMAATALKMLPHATLGTIGLYRNEKTLEPIAYHHKPAKITRTCDILVLDPLLATGGTSSAAISMIKDSTTEKCNIRMLSIVSAPEGLEKLGADHPDVRIFTCATDEKLNDNGYIIPGVGDVGDRYCGTLE